MDKKTLQHIDKAVYIALMILTAVGIIIAMIAGPMGHETLANAASVCAGIISCMVLLHTIRAMRSPNHRK